jgi:hypothetical protein
MDIDELMGNENVIKQVTYIGGGWWWGGGDGGVGVIERAELCSKPRPAHPTSQM